MLESPVEEEGFAVFPEVFNKNEMEALIDSIALAAPRCSRAGVRHALALGPVASIAHDPRLMQLARSVLGATAFPFHATLFDKSAVSNWLVVWHQDKALPLRERRDLAGWGPWSIKDGVVYANAPARCLSQVLALRIHLDDSTSSNGPLRVLPGTHALGVLDDNRIHELSAKINAVECLTSAGGIVAMRPLLVHASSKSQADAKRRVLHIEYAASREIAAPLELAVAADKSV